MKKVFSSSSEVAHIWASQSQEEGRAGNIFFQGNSIYSYGLHFEIARHVGDIVLFTTRGYSNSTAKHKSHVINAITHKTVYDVLTFEGHDKNIRDYIERIRESLSNALRAVKHGGIYLERAEETVKEACSYADHFRDSLNNETKNAISIWRRKLQEGNIFPPAERARMKERQKVETKVKKEKRARIKKDAVEQMDRWRNGGDINPPYGTGFSTVLRLKNDRIETSRGAQITVKVARILWRALSTGHNPQGMTLDNYTVNSWDGKTLVIGCHEIPGSELERLAPELGLKGTIAV